MALTKQLLLNKTRLLTVRMLSTNTKEGDKQNERSKKREENKVLYNKIIHASLINAKNYGFNDRAIAAACCDLNLPSVTGAILPNGPYDVVTFALDHWL
jgi:ubiquinone biosynthesis protein COQ9